MPPKPRPQGKRKHGQVPLPPGATAGRRTLLLLLAGGGLVVLVAVLGVLLLAGGSSAKADAPKLLEAAGCSFETVKALKAGDHSVLTAGGISKKWNTSPPTSGPHYESAALWGAYTAPLQQAQVVHNLEHGGIFIQYGKAVPASTVQELQGFYDTHRDGTLLAPLPSLGSKIALGVWVTKSTSSPDTGVAHLAECTRFDEAAYAAFFDRYQFQGPERFPPGSLAPGS